MRGCRGVERSNRSAERERQATGPSRSRSAARVTYRHTEMQHPLVFGFFENGTMRRHNNLRRPKKNRKKKKKKRERGVVTSSPFPLSLSVPLQRPRAPSGELKRLWASFFLSFFFLLSLLLCLYSGEDVVVDLIQLIY